MITSIHSFRTHGINPVPVTVECQVTDGIGIHLVGLADTAVKESILRVATALEANGFRIPGKKVIINIAPADLRKEVLSYDLPIALAIIGASAQREFIDSDHYIVAGELTLDGSVRDINGWMQAMELAKQTGRGCVLPYDTAKLAAAIDPHAEVYGVKSLGDAVGLLTAYSHSRQDGYLADSIGVKFPEFNCRGAWDAIRGNFGAKRALEIAAAGGHPVLLVGPQEAHKENFARALNEILPPLTETERDEVQRIYSVTGKRIAYGYPPFRSVMFWPILSDLLGGGADTHPGIVSLAHNGVLYVDGYAVLPNAVKQALRGPVEDGKVSISRLHGKVEYPAKFLPVLGTLPCPCGHHGENEGCTCTAAQRLNYFAKLSGPVYDRVAVQAWVHPEPETKVPAGESVFDVAERVDKARRRQMARQGCLNNDLHSGAVCQESFVGEAAFEMLNNIVTRMGLSVRAYAHIIRIARTIADLEGVEAITPQHICEASTYRFLDRPAA